METPAAPPATKVGGGQNIDWSSTWPISTTFTSTPNIVWQGTTSGSTYTSANTALGYGSAAGGSSRHLGGSAGGSHS